jgi:hypothetical protein
MFDWVPLSVQCFAQSKFSQSHSRGPGHRFTDVIARKNIPLDDDRTDSASKQIHRCHGSSRSTAYDNDRVLFLHHWEFFTEISELSAAKMNFMPIFGQDILLGCNQLYEPRKESVRKRFTRPMGALTANSNDALILAGASKVAGRMSLPSELSN